MTEDFEPAAVTTRSGVRESVHAAAVVVLGADGAVELAVGNPDVAVYPRSAMKPLQAAGMIASGLQMPDPWIALACASHAGQPIHVDGVREMLASIGVDERALGNSPSLPLDPAAAEAVLREGGGPSAIRMNCSGKHAAMLATCAANGWPTEGYLDPMHPLQWAITEYLPVLAGEGASHIGIDGCGAPAHVLGLAAVARAFRAIASGGAPEVYRAMTSYPALVGGPGRDVTVLMEAIPGLVAKDGAEGVYAAAMPDGRAVAVKVADGAARARVPLLLAALAAAGVAVSAVPPDTARVAVLGHGRTVGEVHPIGPLAAWWTAG